MKKFQKIGIGFLFLIGVGVVVYPLMTSGEDGGKATVLEKVITLPNANADVYFGKPVSYAFSKDKIFVSDQGASKIHVFNFKGEFIRQIGRKGSGPGEFMMLGNIAYDNNRLFVNDFGNGRIAKINLDSNETEYIFPQPQPDKFLVYNDKIFTTHSVSPKQDIDQLPLIWKYDLEMNLENKFGDFLTEQAEGMTAGASSLFLKIYNGHLYVLFEHYPILRIYTFKGELTDTINFDTYYGEKARPNYASNNFTDPSYLDLENLFGGFDITDEGIFIYTYDERYIMDFFTHEGKRLQRFKRDESYWLMNMHVVAGKDSGISFILGSFNPPEINILRWNKDK